MSERYDRQGQTVVAMAQDGTFAGMVAFVTGVASGIGRAAALAFARADARRRRRRDRKHLLDYADSNVRINAICPGIVDTEMGQRFSGGTSEGRQAMTAQEPIGRMGRPEAIAATVVWLCSDAASFVVEHAMVVDGQTT